MRIPSAVPAFLVSVSFPLLLAQSPAARALVEGNIVNAATNAPLAGGRVKLQPPQNQEPIYGKVDTHGHFIFRDLQPGSYQLVIDVPGFHESRSSVDVSVPRRAGVGGVLGGVITSYRGSQIPQPNVTKTTDDDGTIHATLTAPMLAYAIIVGKVTDPYGEPVAGASIEISKPWPQPPAGAPAASVPARPYMHTTMVQADSRGEYRAGRLEPGTYLVLANKANGIARWTWQSNYRITYYPAALDQASAQPLNIEAGQQVRADIRILKQSGVSVSGQLLGLPASKSLYTRMALKPVNSNAVNPDSPFTSAEKDFAFTDVLPGRYTLYAQTEDAMSDPVNPNRKPLFGLVKDVEIGSQDLAGFDLTLQPMKTLTGQVEVAGNCALPAYVQLQGSTPLGFGQVEGPIASDGTFELTKVPAGRYNKVMVSRTENPLGPMSVVSAIKGSRDVVKEGLESPWQEDQILKIRVACSDQGVRQ